jgi:ubiquinone/menaquinone biosynthesis C-methylase UbiE
VWKQAIRGFARVLNLDLKHAQRRYFETLNEQIRPGVRWLDLGCGHQIVPAWAAREDEQNALVSRTRMFAGADLDPAIADHPYLRMGVFARGEALPFQSGSFDVITANMVVEHLPDPEVTFAELKRVAALDGRILFHTPNLRFPYVYLASLLGDSLKKLIIRILERREDKDIFPTHYRANTVESVRAMAARVGLEVDYLEVGGSVGSFNMMGPLGVLELPFLKLLTLRPFRERNATIIAILRKSAEAHTRATATVNSTPAQRG